MRVQKPIEQRYKTNDPTVEKLGELLAENPNGLSLVRDELSGHLRSLEKWGREGDREFYLEGWNGNGSFDIDRIQRGRIHVPALCVSIIGGIQPGKLKKYVAETLQGGIGDDGLLQRFQLIVYPEISKDWELVDRAPDKAASKRAEAIYRKIANLNPGELGAKSDGDVPSLRFSPGAQGVFDAFQIYLEELLRSGEINCPSVQAHLSKYRSTFPSLALVFHVVEWVDGRTREPAISSETALQVWQFMEWLEAHARKVYAGAVRPDLLAAHTLAEKISQRKVVDGQTVREIHRKRWSFLTDPEVINSGLKILEECGWLRVEEVQTKGRSSRVVRLHPDFTDI